MNLTGVHFGQMDVRVKIEEPTVAKDAITGEDLITTWTEFCSVWAKRMSLSDERFEANQAVSLTGSAYLIRHKEGVTSQMRVNDSEEYHYIKGIEKVDRKQYMVLKTEQRDNNG